MTKPCFQLKADFLPITTLKLTRYTQSDFQSQLEKTVLKAPQYFTHAPMIVDFSNCTENTLTAEDLQQLCGLMRQYQMIPLAFRGQPNQAALPNLPDQKPQAPLEISKPEKDEKSKTKIITKPVRSGTRVYAKDSDLIVLSSVNAGAEIIADGNIHVYGPLRGRALAGANGNTDAHIFCQDLEAELVAIAGHYFLHDKIPVNHSKKNMMHVFLENDTLQIEMI